MWQCERGSHFLPILYLRFYLTTVVYYCHTNGITKLSTFQNNPQQLPKQDLRFCFPSVVLGADLACSNADSLNGEALGRRSPISIYLVIKPKLQNRLTSFETVSLEMLILLKVNSIVRQCFANNDGKLDHITVRLLWKLTGVVSVDRIYEK